MSIRQFEEWREYADLEPFGEIRDDIRIASVVQALYNINRPKGSRRIKLADCVINFGKRPQPDKPKSAEEARKQVRQTMDMLMLIYNKKPTRKRK